LPGLAGASGSTVGPDGALYVAEGAAGRIARVDPHTGDVTTFAEGLPQAILPIGGVTDVAFLDGTAYALVTIVGDDLEPIIGQEIDGHVVGIYRIDGPNSNTPIADIGAWTLANPSASEVFILTGVQYAMETFRGGFIVTDGHHNRVLNVSADGEVSELLAFDNIVPTGLETHGRAIFMAQAGPNPHEPEDGKVVRFGPNGTNLVPVAAGAPLLVDVEYGLGRSLYALAQGDFPDGAGDGSPAMPNTGSLVQVNADGTFTEIIAGLNQPTSLEFIGPNAYVVTLNGEVWQIENVSSPPYGRAMH